MTTSRCALLALMANAAQGAYMLVNDFVNGDCETQGDGAALKQYDFSDSVLDFRDLGYYSVQGAELNSYVQMHCHPDRGYQVLVWHGSHASEMRYGTVGVDGGNTWDSYTGYPRYTLSVNADNKANFLAGNCVKEGGYDDEAWSELLSVRFYTEGATVYLPDCEDYDPGEFCPNCYKMSEFLGLGFDLTEDSSHLNQRQHVARLMGEEEAIEGSTYVSIDNTDFREVDSIVQEGSTSSFVDSGSMQSSRSLELGVEGSYGVADIESSVGLSESESSSFEASMARSETSLQKGLNTIEFKSSDSNYYPTFQFWKAMDGMNDYCYAYPLNPSNYCYDYFVDNIVEEFGTHYISKITMGGQVKFIQETSSCMEASARATAVETSLCVGVDSADIEGCATATQTDSSTTAQSSSIESFMLEIVGGDDTVSLQVCTYSDEGFACDFAAFAETVNDDTAGVVTFELRETVALVEKISSNQGRWQSARGGWAGFEGDYLEDFYAEYIVSKSAANQGCCGGCVVDVASSHFSLFTLTAAVCFTMVTMFN